MSTEMIPVPDVAPEAPAARLATVREYFAFDRASEVRNEYVDGVITGMAGGSPAHNRVARNICVQLETAFGDRACESFIADVRARVSSSRYRYPDVVALCGEAQFDRENPPSLLNPVVVFEVLSPSTQGSDRDEKFMEYRQLETLTDYLLVSQDKVEVAHFARQSVRQWVVTIYNELQDVVALSSLDVTMSLADIYRKVVFEPAENKAAQ